MLQKYVVTLKYGRKLFDVELTSSSLELAQKRAIIMLCVSRHIPIDKTSHVKVVA